MHRSLLLPALSFLLIAPLLAADNLLHDPDLSSVGKPGSAWQAAIDKGGKVESAVAADGKTSALHLMAAAINQQVNLPIGNYELTVQAKGGGELLITANGERPQMLGKDWGTYGYLFHSAGTSINISIGADVDATIASAAILPATPEQEKALQAEADERVRIGFVKTSAQRPSPGMASLQFEGNVKPLDAMKQLVVLDDSRMSTCNAAHVDRLVHWLEKNGFTGLDGDKLPVWMSERIAKKDAYGSVVVLPRGITPIKLLNGPQNNKPLWLQYLRAGGRIVHMGDLPFDYEEATGPEPGDIMDAYARGPVLLDLGYGSGIYYGNYPVTATEACKEWGIENADASSNGVAVENTSMAFHVYTVPKFNKQGASDYFRNLRPDMPWSGLIKFLQSFDGNNDSHLRDVWRAANYVGQPVMIPQLPPPPEPVVASKIQMKAGGMDQRHEFVRGEEVGISVTVDPAHRAGTVQLDLMQDGKSLSSETHPGSNPTFTLKTAPYADGSYDLQATVLQDGKEAEKESEKIGIRYLSPGSFNFEVEFSPVATSARNDMIFSGMNAIGMEFYTGPFTALSLDSMVRNHVGFSFRAVADLTNVKGKPFTYETHPEYYQMNSEGKPVTTGPYSGGRPMNGFTHPDILENLKQDMKEQIQLVAQLPSFRPYILTNDDFSAWYAFDYSPHVLAAYKADTGSDAPRKMELPAKPGAIPETDPWFQWQKWTIIHVNGGINKAETEAATEVRPDIRIGPIPGGAGMPLIQMEQGQQYPPYSFGKDGFNLIASYYYSMYWSPALSTTYWMEVGRMGNRDLPEWNMPNVTYGDSYTQNEFYLYMAGGVQGLAYFNYEVRTKGAWTGIERVAPVVRRVGPVQMEIKPAHRDIGLLSSFTSYCFNPGITTYTGYAYDNLVQAHLSTEMVAEEDILAGRASQYKAILLYQVKYLRQSVYDALVKYAANGGVVLLDATIPFDLPGAKRIQVDTGTGTAKAEGMAVDDYGRADRIALVQQVISPYVKPQFDSSDIKVAASNFEANGVPYTWFVNVEDQKENDFSRIRAQDQSPKNYAEVVAWENSEMAKGPYMSTITYDSLPGIPYDLVSGRKLDVAKTAEGRFAVTLSMERFGGSLVAWYPVEITEVKLTAPPTASAATNQPVHITATVLAQAKPLPGVDSVEFTWHDPNGKASIISGVRAAKNGEADFDWTPAINDPTGPWTLEAKELASGKTAQVQIDLAK